MGKTKTAFIGDLDAKKEKKEKKEKIHVAGQKGGERVAMIDATPVISESEAAKKLKKARVRSKNYLEAKAKVDHAKLYQISQAITLARETSLSSFDGTLELHLVVRKEGLAVNVELPHQAGRIKVVEVADENTIKKLESGKIDFDILLATAEMMPKLVSYARVLGPRGLMPNPKNGTVIKDKKDAAKFNVSKVTIKTEKSAPLIHTVVGKLSMKDSELTENLNALLDAINRKQIVKAYVKATMGPSVKLVVE